MQSKFEKHNIYKFHFHLSYFSSLLAKFGAYFLSFRWLLLPAGNSNADLETLVLSRDENMPCTIGYASCFIGFMIVQKLAARS